MSELMYKKIYNRVSQIAANKQVLCISFLVFFIPKEYAIGSLPYLIWQVLMMLCGIVYTLLCCTIRPIKQGWLSISLFYLFVYLVAPLLSNSDASYLTRIYGAVRGIGFISLCEFCNTISQKKLLRTFAVAGTVMVAAHLVSVIMYFNVQGGMRAGFIETQLGASGPTNQHWYLLTYDNESILYVLPVTVSCYLAAARISSRWFIPATVLTSLYFMTVIIQDSISAIVAMAAFICGISYFYMRYRFRNNLRISCNTSRAILIVLLACDVLIIIGVCSGVLSSVATSLGKDPTFSGRKYIWTKSLECFLSRPLAGFGVETAARTYSKIAQSHCHNILIEIMYSGGLTALMALSFGCYRLTAHVEAFGRNALSKGIVLSGIAGILIAAMMDWSPSIPIPFILLYFLSLGKEHEREVSIN